MSEELIKRLREAADNEYLWGHDVKTAALVREAADALESRPAPVQVPEGLERLVRDQIRAAYDDGFNDGDKARSYAGRNTELLRGNKVMGELSVMAAAPSAPVAPAVDAEKVMALVKQYAISYHYRATGLHAHGMDEAHAAVESAIRALLTPANVAHGWIPVGERLPDMEAGYVLVHCEGGKIGDDFFCRNREFLHHAGNCYSRKHQGKESGYFGCAHEYGYRITHWQPLPPPPAIANQEAQDGR